MKKSIESIPNKIAKLLKDNGWRKVRGGFSYHTYVHLEKDNIEILFGPFHLGIEFLFKDLPTLLPQIIEIPYENPRIIEHLELEIGKLKSEGTQ